jgi:hypothetical protein
MDGLRLSRTDTTLGDIAGILLDGRLAPASEGAEVIEVGTTTRKRELVLDEQSLNCV